MHAPLPVENKGHAPRADAKLTILPAYAAYNLYLNSSIVYLDCCTTRQPTPTAASINNSGGGAGGYGSDDDLPALPSSWKHEEPAADDGHDGALPGSAWLSAGLPVEEAAACALRHVLDERTPDDATMALILHDDHMRAQALAAWLTGALGRSPIVMATERGVLQASHPFLFFPGALSLRLPNEIVPGRLYLGSAASSNEQSLRLLRITHVLSLVDRSLEVPADPAAVAHKLVKIADSRTADMDGALLEALPFIAAALAHPAGRLLVHCEAGVSRSATAVIAALMANVANLADEVSSASGSGLSYEEALALVRAQRPGVRPNDGFEACLRREAWMDACVAGARSGRYL